MRELLSKDMAINILKFVKSDDIMSDCKELGEMDCFRKYMQDADGAIPLTPLFVYVVLLYSKDSFLNRKPIEDLSKRKLKAAALAELDVDNTTIQNLVFEMGSEKIVALIHGYLITQNNLLWIERVTLESQIEECHRIRLSPVSAEKDKDLLDAFNKKAALTEHFTRWHDLLRGYDREIFSDHDDVKKSKVVQSATIESYAR